MLSHHISLALAEENHRNLTPDSRQRTIARPLDREALAIAGDASVRRSDPRQSAIASARRRPQGRLRRLVGRSQSSFGS
jgi:hypothetical protein